MSQTKAQLISDLVQSLNFTGISAAPANGMYLSAANTISLGINSAQLLTVNGTRILTKSPSGTDTTVRFQHTGNSGYGDIILDRSVNAFIIDNDPTNASNNQSYFSVKNKGATNLYIKHDGKVLIGTTTSNTSDRFTIVDPGNAFMSLRSDAEADGNSQIIDFAVGTADRSSSNLVSTITSTIPTGAGAGGTLKGYLAFSTNAGDSLSERLRITPGGHVLIGDETNDNAMFRVTAADGEADDLYVGQFINSEGTAGRNYGINIQGGSNSTDHGLRLKNHGGTTQFLIRGDGNVGIGTTSPSFLLDIRKDATSVKTHIGASDGTLATMPNSSEYGLSVAGGNVEFGLHKDANGAYQAILGTYQGTTDIPLVFRTASRVERLRIRKDGKLQIGTAGGDSTYLALAGNAAMDLWGDGSEYPTLRLGTEVYNTVGEDIRFGRSDHGTADIRYHSLKSLHGSSAADNYLEFFLHDFGGSPYTSQKSAFKVNGLGNAIIPDGDLVIGTAGHGIDFSATGGPTSGSDTSELLDDYEEGNWTPSVASWMGNTPGSGGTPTVSTVNGKYVKIAKLVICYCTISFTSSTSAGTSGHHNIGGLPYSATNYNGAGNGGYGGGSINNQQQTGQVYVENQVVYGYPSSSTISQSTWYFNFHYFTDS